MKKSFALLSEALLITILLMSLLGSILLLPIIQNLDASTNTEFEPKVAADWTYMVYLDADNNLDSYGLADINEMEHGYSSSVSSDVNVIVFIDREYSGAKTYRIIEDHNLYSIASPILTTGFPSEPNMGLWARYKHQKELRWEKYVFENADGLTFQSPYYLDVAEPRYNMRGEIAVIPNAVLADDLPRKSLPKLSQKDGQVHTVFVGHVNRLKLDRVKEIADRGIPVHLYTFHSSEFEPLLLTECKAHEYLYYHGALPRRQLLLALTQYDFGLVLWYRGATEPFFHTVLPSKMFYYLASGLPVIVAPYRSISEFVLSRGCGFVLTHIDELEDKIYNKRYTVGDRAQYTVEHYIPNLVRLYRKLV